MSKKLYITGSKNIKDLLLRVFSQKEFKNLKVLDFPAGSGFTANYLTERGAIVTAWDMFPEFFQSKPNLTQNQNVNSKALTCLPADLQKKFPAADHSFDVAVFQEGIEHLPDQLYALKEFYRVLKADGILYITTPNYSNLRSRLAYFLFESEMPKMMPPNELESIWFGKDNRIYMGHVFSIGIMRLRMLAMLAGFRIHKVHPGRINWTSFVLGLFFYPLIFLQTIKTYFRAKRKLKASPVLLELLRLNLHPGVLFGGHLIVELTRQSQQFAPNLDNTDITET